MPYFNSLYYTYTSTYTYITIRIHCLEVKVSYWKLEMSDVGKSIKRVPLIAKYCFKPISTVVIPKLHRHAVPKAKSQEAKRNSTAKKLKSYSEDRYINITVNS